MSAKRIVFYLNKLIRDNLPEMMRGRAQKPSVTTLTGDKLVVALVNKLTEESRELDPKSPKFLQELSEVTQVLDDLLETLDAREEVERLRQADLARRGGFRKGQYISTLSLAPDDEWVEYYRKEPERFREERSE